MKIPFLRLPVQISVLHATSTVHYGVHPHEKLAVVSVNQPPPVLFNLAGPETTRLAYSSSQPNLALSQVLL